MIKYYVLTTEVQIGVPKQEQINKTLANPEVNEIRLHCNNMSGVHNLFT